MKLSTRQSGLYPDILFLKKEETVMGKTSTSEREINKSSQSLRNKAAEPGRGPGLMEVET